MHAAVEDADVVALLTEWDEFKRADPNEIGELVTVRRIVDEYSRRRPQGLSRQCIFSPTLSRGPG